MSIKTIDLTARSYAKASAVKSRILSDARKLAKFSSGYHANVPVEANSNTVRILDVGIEPGVATFAQWYAMTAAKMSAMALGITVRYINVR